MTSVNNCNCVLVRGAQGRAVRVVPQVQGEVQGGVPGYGRVSTKGNQKGRSKKIWWKRPNFPLMVLTTPNPPPPTNTTTTLHLNP